VVTPRKARLEIYQLMPLRLLIHLVGLWPEVAGLGGGASRQLLGYTGGDAAIVRQRTRPSKMFRSRPVCRVRALL
jgi:hypothetical protein